ncbi:tyrosine-type recombinase/integrase [Rouxiella silvae]|uniref:tyrosine-type recombinase/integrase n=1 Tax=Rouxiella silvae TaxID=1646373 RepID=UPI0039EFC27F
MKPISRGKVGAEIKEAVDHLKTKGQIPYDAVIAMHSIRKTVATMAYKAGEDLAQISHMLGHKSIDHTRAYIGVTQKASDTLRQKYSTGIKVR